VASSGPHLIGFKLPRVNISCTHVTTNEVICDAVIGYKICGHQPTNIHLLKWMRKGACYKKLFVIAYSHYSR